MRRTNLHLPDALANLVDAAHRASGQTPDVPVLSNSEVLRLLVQRGAQSLCDPDDPPVEIDGTDLYDLVPEHQRILWEREHFKNGEAQLRNLRTGFEPRVKRHFKTRFKNGTRPEQIQDWAINMRMDARILFPGEEHQQRRNECLSYVDTFVDAFKNAYRVSSVDMLDPETSLSFYGGVEEGAQWHDVDPEQFVDMAVSARDQLHESNINGQKPDVNATGDVVARAYGVGEDVGEKAAKAGREMLRRDIRDPDPATVMQLIADEQDGGTKALPDATTTDVTVETDGGTTGDR